MLNYDYLELGNVTDLDDSKGVFIFHHRRDPKTEPSETFPKNFDVVVPKDRKIEVREKWDYVHMYNLNCHGPCSLSVRAARLLTTDGVDFVPVLSGDYLPGWKDREGIMKKVHRSLKIPFSEGYNVLYINPEGEVNEINYGKHFKAYSVIGKIRELMTKSI